MGISLSSRGFPSGVFFSLVFEIFQGCGLGSYIQVFTAKIYIAPFSGVFSFAFWLRGSLFLGPGWTHFSGSNLFFSSLNTLSLISGHAFRGLSNGLGLFRGKRLPFIY
jgi:hypothetical protein